MTDILATANVIQVYRGTSRTIALTVTDEAGAPFNLTGWSISFTLKKRACPNDDILVQKTSADIAQIKVIDVLAGTVEIYLTPADTTHCPADYYYDVWIKKGTEIYLVVVPTVFEILATVSTLT